MAQADITLNIVNQNQDITDPWVTFIQSQNAISTWETNGFSSTTPNGPLLSAMAGSTTLVSGTSYQLSAIGNTITMGENWAGNIFFSNQAITTMGSSGQSPVQSGTAPFPIAAFSQPTLYSTNPNGAVTSDTTRYNYIELGGGSTSSINPDITYINYYSVPIQMTRASDGATRGAPSSQAALANLAPTLTALSGNNSAVVVSDSQGTARVISPDNGATSQVPYPDFTAFITASFDTGAKPINLSNAYSGHGSETGPIATQTYTGSAVTWVGGTTLTMTGTASVVDDYTITWTGSASDLSQSIYSAVLNNYQVVYGPDSTTKTGNTGDNDVFSAITRDLLAGYNFGFINSNATSSLGTIGDLTSEQWMTLSYNNAFGNAQTDNPYYNQWAAAFASTFTDVYTFPFNDYLSGFSPEMSIGTGDTLTVTLLGTVPEPSTVGLAILGTIIIACAAKRKYRKA